MNIKLDKQSMASIDNIIARGYASNRTEALRQALLCYARQVAEKDPEIAKLLP